MRQGDTRFTTHQWSAIATDYAANLSAGLQILSQKWNELAAADMLPNNRSASAIESWFLAAWTYNSGFHPNTGSYYGLGWFNNPANPRYPADRQPFLRATYDDAAHPGNWSYEEKIMGWAETPQRTYFSQLSYIVPSFGAGAGGRLTLPRRTMFCTTVNWCDSTLPGGADPCPTEDEHCWFHGFVNYASCPDQCATERSQFAAGSPEPPMTAQYPANCTVPGLGAGTIIVDDISDSSVNVRGCAGAPRGGKFTLRAGDHSYPNADIARIDLHQIGAGYLGHLWFTHTEPPIGTDGYVPEKVRVVGTWTPEGIRPGGYTIKVHMPDHGAGAGVDYVIFPGIRDGVIQPQQVFHFQQSDGGSTNRWVTVGVSTLYPGARVELSNITPDGDGDVDIAYDAMAFVPTS
jgi:hypothetical protein